MKNKSSISPALWFIPLVALVLTVLFVFLGFIGWKIIKSFAASGERSNQSSVVAQAQLRKTRKQPQSEKSETQNRPQEEFPVVPSTQEETPSTQEETPSTQEETPSMQEVPDMPTSTQQAASQTPTQDVCPSSYVPVKIKKIPAKSINYTRYQRGLMRCQERKIYPCAWEENTQGVVKQYWLMSADGPITRGVYDMSGNLLSETIATVNGTVTSYTEKNTTWYFQGGVLVKIRTTPYANCNFHDWFFIRQDGKQDVCQCAYTTPDCCARSPYREGMGRSYCDLFPLDKEFCKLKKHV